MPAAGRRSCRQIAATRCRDDRAAAWRLPESCYAPGSVGGPWTLDQGRTEDQERGTKDTSYNDLKAHRTLRSPAGRRFHPPLREQPVFAQLTAVAALGEQQQEFAGQRKRAVVRL